MFLRFLLFALMGVGIVGFTGVAWMASHTGNDAVAAAPLVPATKIKVVTINRPVRAGTLLKSATASCAAFVPPCRHEQHEREGRLG